jgi:hypothetical protein
MVGCCDPRTAAVWGFCWQVGKSETNGSGERARRAGGEEEKKRYRLQRHYLYYFSINTNRSTSRVLIAHAHLTSSHPSLYPTTPLEFGEMSVGMAG